MVTETTVSFLACIMLHEHGHLNIFSTPYKENDFCISIKDKSMAFHSHAISFYANAMTALVMSIFIRVGRGYGLREAALKPIAENVVALFSHGCAHFFLSFKTNVSGATQALVDLSPSERAVGFIALTFVWYNFMRDSQISLSAAVALAIIHNIVQVFILPTRFFLMHVLLAVFLNRAVHGFTRRAEDKDRYYSMEFILMDVPILLASFGETLTCDSFLVKYGGHVWFDMVIPIMFCVYFGVLTVNPNKAAKTKSV